MIIKWALRRENNEMTTPQLESIGRSPLRPGSSVIALALTCSVLLLSPKTFGVSPPPDGGYPGGNTAEGQSALLSLAGGTYNAAVGWLSLTSNTTGNYNTAIGAATLFGNTTGSNNTANGLAALCFNTTGSANTANGNFALFANTVGAENTAIGTSALVNNIGGVENTAIGAQALGSNTYGLGNVAVGYQALLNNTTGDGNIAIGDLALSNNTSGRGNIALGTDAGYLVTTANDVICIGDATGANVSHTCFISYIRGVTTINDNAIPVVIDGSNQLGTMSSSRRFKKDIQPMDNASEAVLSLKPVTFQYKNSTTETLQFGLIAEDVARVNPELVVRDNNGEIYTVRYDAVNAMLLNEFLKEHRQVQQQQKQIAKLTTRLNAQAAQLHKVSAQLEVRKPSPRIALNHQ
jgi:Chaperone of endosialidase